MAVNLVLPTLSAWASARLMGLLESKTQDDFDTTFNGTFAANCTFTVNGKTIPREAYQAQLLGQSAAGFGESATTVTIEEQTQVEIGNQGQLAGVVGLFYSALSESKFLVLGAPTEKRDTSSLNLMIEPTEKNPQTKLHTHGYFDPRRVTSVNQVVSESTYHVTIPHAAVPQKAATTAKTASTKIELGPGPLDIPVGPFGGVFGPGPVKLTPGSFGPGPVHVPPSETGATPETLPGFGAFGAGPVITPGETIGETKDA